MNGVTALFERASSRTGSAMSSARPGSSAQVMEDGTVYSNASPVSSAQWVKQFYFYYSLLQKLSFILLYSKTCHTRTLHCTPSSVHGWQGVHVWETSIIHIVHINFSTFSNVFSHSFILSHILLQMCGSHFSLWSFALLVYKLRPFQTYFIKSTMASPEETAMCPRMRR